MLVCACCPPEYGPFLVEVAWQAEVQGLLCGAGLDGVHVEPVEGPLGRLADGARLGQGNHRLQWLLGPTKLHVLMGCLGLAP